MDNLNDKIFESLQQAAKRTGHTLDLSAEKPPTSLLDAARHLDREVVTKTVGQALGLPFMDDLTQQTACPQFVEKIPISFARQHGVLGLSSDNGQLPVAMADLDQWEQLEVISRFLNRPVRPIFVPLAQVTMAINAAYQEREGQTQDFIEKLDRNDVLAAVQQLEDREDLLDVARRAPVIQLVNLVLFEAVKLLSSDVHIQPFEDRLMVRMRIDGVLSDTFSLPKHLQEEIVSRIKVLAKMNIAEKRLAQDGRATVQVGDKLIDLRVSSIPTNSGERIVIRLLDKTGQLFSLDEIGMEPKTLDQFLNLITIEHGLILVTGPTGSGKSTTLYAALQKINGKERNILTLEDPIEYQLPGISQTQVSAKKGMTFASGLRSVLRQDPDVIMVGEIRDHETAVMAIQSALTGHLVFSTLHTNDAASAVTRLLDLGIEPYLVASSLVCVMAQRLVRQVCTECGQSYTPEASQLQSLGLEPHTLDLQGVKRGTGCENCRQTGYRRRLGLFELLVVDKAIQEHIQVRATASQIKTTAIDQGMTTLANDGMSKMLNGLTTIEEVSRVTTREIK